MVVLVLMLVRMLVLVVVLVVLLVSVVDALLSPTGIVVVVLLFHQVARCLLQHKLANTWKATTTKSRSQRKRWHIVHPLSGGALQ